MRNPAIVLTISLFLTACSSPAASTPTTIPTETATPPPTSTPRPTLTPTPSGPNGATGKDAEGRWTKVEDGKTYVYMEFPLGSETYKGWFESRMKKGPINLTDGTESMFGPFTLDFSLFFAKDFEYDEYGSHLIRPAGTSDYVKKGVKDSSVASWIIYDLFLYETGLTTKTVRKEYAFNDPKEVERYFGDVKRLMVQLSDGKSIALGEASWEPRKGFDQYWINEADAAGDPAMYHANGLYAKIVVIEGKLVAIMAASEPDVFEESKFRRLMLAPLGAATHGVSEKIVWMDYQAYGGLTGKGATISGPSGTVTITTETISLVP